MKTIFEQQGVEYRQAGDYMLPNVGMGEQNVYIQTKMSAMKKS